LRGHTGTRITNLLMSFRFRSSRRARRNAWRTSESGHEPPRQLLGLGASLTNHLAETHSVGSNSRGKFLRRAAYDLGALRGHQPGEFGIARCTAQLAV